MGYLVLIIGFVISAFIYTTVRDLPPVEAVLQHGVSPTHYAQVYSSDGTVILSYGKFRHHEVSLQEVSPNFVNALLATEDRRFYQHHGVDPMALGRALLRDITHKRLLEGGSTLTQQLARNVFLSNERSVSRKLREAILAIEIEQHLSKTQILELYINNIYFGEGAYGIAAASEIYFNKEPSELTVDEAAMLAGMPQAPSSYSPFRNPKEARARRDEVLHNLEEYGKLTSGQVAFYQAKPFHLNPDGLALGAADKAPFFNRYVLKQIQEQFDLDEQSFWQSGLKIYTTLDSHAQAIAARVVREQSNAADRKSPQQQAALLCLNPKTGGILAYVGGKDYGQSQFDRVTQAVRSPGSLFKVFTYTAAIEKGYSPYKTYVDEPIYFDAWHPENFDRQHYGAMPLYQAFYTSNNVIAVKLLRDLQPSTVIDLAHRMGLHANLADNLSLTLGGSGVTLLDITAAFAVLPNSGNRSEPYAIERIVDADNHELYQHKGLRTEVLNRPTVDTIIAMMLNVVQRGTARAADIGRQVAGKTGTSDDHRDAWFIGYTPDLITGVWVGNDDNSSMPHMVGGALPALIWRNYMQALVANRLQTNFDLTYSKLTRANQAGVNNTSNNDTSETDSNAATTEEATPEDIPKPGDTPPGTGEIPPTNTLPPVEQTNLPLPPVADNPRYNEERPSQPPLPPVSRYTHEPAPSPVYPPRSPRRAALPPVEPVEQGAPVPGTP